MRTNVKIGVSRYMNMIKEGKKIHYKTEDPIKYWDVMEETEAKRINGIGVSENGISTGVVAARGDEIEVLAVNGLNTMDTNDESEEVLRKQFFDEETWEGQDPVCVRAARK